MFENKQNKSEEKESDGSQSEDSNTATPMAKQPTGQEENLEEASKAYQKAQIRFTLKTDNLLEEEE